MKIEEKFLKILKKPHVSEKASAIEEKGQYIFKVDRSANKFTIKKAIEELFKVKVASIRICNVKGKPKAFGRKNSGYRQSWKKAYVTLGMEQKIDYSTLLS